MFHTSSPSTPPQTTSNLKFCCLVLNKANCEKELTARRRKKMKTDGRADGRTCNITRRAAAINCNIHIILHFYSQNTQRSDQRSNRPTNPLLVKCNYVNKNWRILNCIFREGRLVSETKSPPSSLSCG